MLVFQSITTYEVVQDLFQHKSAKGTNFFRDFSECLLNDHCYHLFVSLKWIVPRKVMFCHGKHFFNPSRQQPDGVHLARVSFPKEILKVDFSPGVVDWVG